MEKAHTQHLEVKLVILVPDLIIRKWRQELTLPAYHTAAALLDENRSWIAYLVLVPSYLDHPAPPVVVIDTLASVCPSLPPVLYYCEDRLGAGSGWRGNHT